LAYVIELVAAEGQAIESTLLRKDYRTKTRWRVIVVFLVLAIVVGLSAVGIGGVGHWLVVVDPLENAHVIAVLSGEIPFRAMEAASIYRNGRATEVWITRAIRPSSEAALAKLGIQFVRGETYNKQVLQKLGVPADAIRLLNKGVRNTEEEVQVIAHELKRILLLLLTRSRHSLYVSCFTQIYETTEDFPKEVKYSLADQMRRAAVSVPSNIAEGAARQTKKEFINYLHIAQGSLSELDTQLEIARRLQFLDKGNWEKLDEAMHRVDKMLTGLIRHQRTRTG